jgi:hypothetical protein
MNNFISLFLAVLTQYGVMTQADAEKLDKEFQQSTLPDHFDSALKMVEKVFEKAGVEPKVFEKK